MDYDDGGGSSAMPYYPSGSNVHANNMVELTNPDAIINNLELAYRGYKNIGGKEVKWTEPLLNDTGCMSVIYQIRSIVNQDSILSWLSERQINNIMENFSETLILDLMINRKLYAVKTYVDMSKVLNMAQDVAYICLMRSREGNDKNFWAKISMEINSMVGGNANANNSLLSKINPFKK